MDTQTLLAERIVAAVVAKFAADHGIAPEHLTTDTCGLTPAEVYRAAIALPEGALDAPAGVLDAH